jgi:hypothetical protein
MVADARPILFDGAIVLMHDGAADGDSRRAQTVRLLPMLAEIADGFDRLGRPATSRETP